MEFAELLKHLLIDLQSIFRKNNKDLPLSLAQVIVISSIPIEGINMTALSQRLGVDNSTLTRLIDILIRNNFIKRKISPNDRRSKIIFLTKSGFDILQKIESNIDYAAKQIFSQFPKEDKIIAKDLLSMLHWNMSKYKLINK